MKLGKYRRLITAAITATAAGSALAYGEPQVNLGLTSFLDGAPPAGPGFYYEQYFEYYNADRLNDNNGNKLPLPDQKFDVAVSVSQLLYMSPTRLLGGNLGFDLLVPALIGHSIDDCTTRSSMERTALET
jgi:hypothetical protein